MGNDDTDGSGNTLRCITDLTSCCTSNQGPHRGNWYFPDGDRLPLVSSSDNIYESRGSRQVSLRRKNYPRRPTGIYRCDVQTVAVHDDVDLSVRAVGSLTEFSRDFICKMTS